MGQKPSEPEKVQKVPHFEFSGTILSLNARHMQQLPGLTNVFFLTASGNEITGTKTYTLGQLMYFEAKQPDDTAQSGNHRIYVKSCFMSASQDSSSNPKYTVIDNHG